MDDSNVQYPTYVYVILYGKRIKALIDSEASRSLINVQVVRSIPQLHNAVIRPSRHQHMPSVDGSKIALQGDLFVHMNFGGYHAQVGVTICEVLFVPLILGIDFMLSEKALLDYDLQVLRMGAQEIPLYVSNIKFRSYP